MKDIIYWLWLSLSVTPGSETFRALIEKFHTPEAIYEADDSDIASCIGSKSADFASITNKDTEKAEEIRGFCDKKRVGILTYSDPAFPDELRKIKAPPVLLYYRGVLPDFNKGCYISMVGTRRLSEYGRKNAFAIGYDLASAGAVVVSGMAIGIDGVSHAGSLSAKGINVAFLGSGIDVCYPSQHQRLAREIVKNGCVMTEYAPGTPPERYNFPRRNRLIAGMSCACVVIEGSEKSGAIITARYAKESGKTVYALPGNVDNKTSEVTNLLIKNGAKLITSADDIVHDLEFVYTGIINPFNLKMKPEVRMDEALSELKISCVTPSDNIFSTYPSGKKSKSSRVKKAASSKAQEQSESAAREPSAENMSFDKGMLTIYKRIPVDGECFIEELADSEYNLPTVMKSLLKLEMGGFIVMLPGEKVKRNLINLK